MPRPVYQQVLTTKPQQSDNANIYVPNSGASSVSVIDSGTDTVVATVPVSGDPVRCAVSPDGNTVWVPCNTSLVLDIITATINAVTNTINTSPNGPVDVAITPDNLYAFLLALDSTFANRADVYMLTVGNPQLVSPVVQPFRPYCISANAAAVYYGGALIGVGNSDVVYGNLYTSSGLGSFFGFYVDATGNTGIPALALSPDGAYIAFVNNDTGTLYQYDFSRNLIASNVIGTGRAFTDICISPDSSLIYVSMNTEVQVFYRYGSPLLSKVASIPLTGLGAGICLTQDGSKGYVSQSNTNNVIVFDARKYTVTDTIAVGTTPLKPGAVPPASQAYNTIQVTQVTSGQNWNVTLSTTQPGSGSGTYTLISGTRFIGRANIGQNIGPFTAYDGEIISIQVQGTAANFIASVSGFSYERGEQVPTVFPGISG